MLKKILIILTLLLISHSFIYNNGYNNGYNNRFKEVQENISKSESLKSKEFEKLYKEMLEKKDEVDQDCNNFLNQSIPNNCLLIHRN